MSPLRPEAAALLKALLTGALLPLAFAPVGFYPLALLSPALLFALWTNADQRHAAWLGFAFGVGQFGVGASWVFVAINEFGNTPAPIAGLMTLLFVCFLALFPALAGYLAARLRRNLSGAPLLLFWLPAWWLMAEWLRGWVLTGFPWLNLGYSMIDAPLRGIAPVLGVYGLSLAAAVSAGALVLLWRERGSWRLALPLLALLWGGGVLLDRIEWTTPQGEPLRVTLIQGNVEQATKWDTNRVLNRLWTYEDLTRENLDNSDLIIWPENAITVFYHSLKKDYFNPLAEALRSSSTDLIAGVPELDADGERYYTTMMSLGSHHGFYRKRHLVPFGEYMPLAFLRGLIDFFDLPMSSFSSGADEQPLLQAAGHKIAATVCYEDAFGEEVIDFLPEATLLVNGSNNAWYGDSLAPHQHLQISRMRALETERPLLRATTNGISAVINEHGEIEARSRQFEREVVYGVVQGRSGSTPYIDFGNWVVLFIVVAGLLFLARPRDEL